MPTACFVSAFKTMNDDDGMCGCGACKRRDCRFLISHQSDWHLVTLSSAVAFCLSLHLCNYNGVEHWHSIKTTIASKNGVCRFHS